MLNITTHSTQNQKGSALIVSLLILVVLTLLGVSAMTSSGLEERMSGNSRDQNLAFESAEAALIDAQEYLENITAFGPLFDGSQPGLYAENSNPDVLADATWNTARTFSGTLTNVTSQPKYIIEYTGTIGDLTQDINITSYDETSGQGEVSSFKITARGTGATDKAKAYLQASYGRRF